MLLTQSSILMLLIGIQAHGGIPGIPPQQQPLAADADWVLKHMVEEHHISNFDAGAFFTLHDFDNTNEWTRDDILKMYGLKDKSTAHVTAAQRDELVNKVIALYDVDKSGTISFAEYTVGEDQGIKLPDFGYGPGHHGDDEYEYEIHHFEKYHGPDSKLEDLTHPEDIEHFQMHEELEAQAERQAALDRMEIVEANIPLKFRRNG